MKRLFTIISILLLSLTLIACNNNTKNVIDEMKITYSWDNSSDYVTEDITLTTTSSIDNAIIEWESDNTDLIKIEGNKGLVTRGSSDVVVTLTVTVSINNKSSSKDFELTVIKDEGLYSITILTDTITVNVDKLIDIPKGTTINFTINVPEGYELIKFMLNNEEVILTNNFYVIESLNGNLIVDAKYEKLSISHLVTFNPNNGDDIYEESIKDGLKVTKPNDPVKAGYKFLGWVLGEDLFDFNTLITADVELVAMWQELFEQVIYKFDFGTAAKSGYDTTSFNFTNTGGDTHTLTKQRAQINVNTNEEIHANQSQMLVLGPVSNKNSSVSLVEFDFSSINNLSKIEFQFTGWNTNAFNRIIGLTNAEFYLQVLDGDNWITLKDSNNKENLLNYLETNNYIFNWVTFNNLNAGKYRLYYNAPGANTSNTGQALVVDDMSVYGLFDAIDGNQVTFDYNYEGSPTNLISIVKDNELVIEPTEPNRLGYDFLGWYLDGKLFNFNTPITKNTTLKAHWQQSKLAITFDFGYLDIEPIIELIDLNQSVAEIAEPQREGYQFIGWYETEINQEYNNQFDFSKKLSSNVRLYAKWENINVVELERNDELLDEYYESIYGLTNNELVFELRDILTQTHNTPTNYGEARYILDKADKALYNKDLVVGIYYRETIKATWDSVSWTREHVWPNSKLGVTNVDNAHINQASDIHNLRAINQNVNSSRGNRYFINTTLNVPVGHKIGTDGYYPGDEDIGDVARILLYMAVRYDVLKLTSDEALLLLGDKTNNNFVVETAYMGMLNVLLDWHLMDPVDEFEISRNEVIYENQGNRNPFIDHPELFEEVFEYFLEVDEQRVIPNRMSITSNVNIYKIDIDYYEFNNRKRYY